MATIEVQGLTKRFGAVLAVDDLSFAVEPGMVTGFLGPNGAGKTTTLRMLLGLVRPTAGRALVNGVAYRDLAEPTRVVGAVLESSGFHPARTARHHLRAMATAAGVPHTRVDEVLDTVGLAADGDRRVGGFSMGMRQRLELARALLGDPEVLILDEPANGLDPQGIAWLRSFLRWFAGRDRVVLVSSHLLAEAAQTVDDVVVLTHGRMAGQGRLQELLRGAATTVRVRTPDAERLVPLLAAAGIRAARPAPDLVEAAATTPEAVGRVMADNGVLVLEMSSSGESLESLFFEMTGTVSGSAPAPPPPPPPAGAPSPGDDHGVGP
ncbi:MAG TPA: ABC transporter ATP-binding protein [Acidimicrobiales bacterium]|nr:ABC transporter ATP-binding protein [Acidimicrobiales bacterium]